MASMRNNKLQERRAKLREQQKRELAAVTAFDRAIEREWEAHIATARLVATSVADFGKERTAHILALEPKEVTAYVKDAEAAEAGSADEPSASASDADATPSAAPEAAAGTDEPTAAPGVPGQAVPPVNSMA